ncbi:MAG: NAD(P)-dependent alcohol dehydrogenase [Deinococcota bacterium]
MHAIVQPRYGSPDVLKLQTLDKPAPKDNEVLVKVHAAAVNAGDWHLLRGTPVVMRLMFGLTKPKYPVLGSDMAGRVVSVGAAVSNFAVGDEVMADLSDDGLGSFAEYVTVPETALVAKPKNVSFEQAASVPVAAITGLQALRDHGNIQAGQKVLVTGASGGVGSFAVQLAKNFGAHVTAVCSTSKVDMVRTLGADEVIDYKQDDFTKMGEHYDLIIDAAAYRPLAEVKLALSSTGKYVLVGGSSQRLFQTMLLGPLMSKKGGQTFTTMLAKANTRDLQVIADMLEQGKLNPVIDKRYPLSEVPEAIAYVEEGRARGKVIITVSD